MTLLTAMHRVCDEVSLPRPLAVVSSSALTHKMLLTCAHQAGDDIARQGDWAALAGTASFPALASAAPLPVDYLRLAKGGAVRLTAPTAEAIHGPVTTEQLQFLRSASPAKLYFAPDSGGLLVPSNFGAVNI